LQADQLLRERSYPVGVTAAPTNVHLRVAAIGSTQVRKRLRECGEATLLLGIVFVAPHEHADGLEAQARWTCPIGPEGSSALFVLFRSVTKNKVLPEIEPYKPRVLKTSLSNEAEAKLKAALSKAV
jgi:hypothetical protein